MGLTYSVVDSYVEANKRVVIADVTFDSAYVTGGEPVDLASLGLASVIFAHVGSKAGYNIVYDHANKKLIVYYPVGAHTHTENTAASYAQNATTGAVTAAAVASQVANAVDLSALSVRIMFVGQ